MPKLEPKEIQRELDRGKLRPVYWLYGPEAMKSRELCKRIRKAALGESPSAFSEERFDGEQCDVSEILAAAQTMGFMSGPKFIFCRGAEHLKNAEQLEPLFAADGTRDSLSWVCVFVAANLDGRKKSSKLLQERAVVVPCEMVAEQDRLAWIQYLAQRVHLRLNDSILEQLSWLEPWSLDIVDNEIARLSLEGTPSELGADSLPPNWRDLALEALFLRKKKEFLRWTPHLASSTEETLLFLGLATWNVRQLTVMCCGGGGNQKLAPFVAQRLRTWIEAWTKMNLLEFQKELGKLDWTLKQTAKLPQAVWDSLAVRHCH